MRKHIIHSPCARRLVSRLVVPVSAVSGSRVPSPDAAAAADAADDDGGSHAETLQPHTSATSPLIMTSEMTDFDEVSPLTTS
jgi:hypothetical protein